MSDTKQFVHGEEGTHSCCDARLKAEGGQTRCCYCVPHDGCEFEPSVTTKCPHDHQDVVSTPEGSYAHCLDCSAVMWDRRIGHVEASEPATNESSGREAHQIKLYRRDDGDRANYWWAKICNDKMSRREWRIHFLTELQAAYNRGKLDGHVAQHDKDTDEMEPEARIAGARELAERVKHRQRYMADFTNEGLGKTYPYIAVADIDAELAAMSLRDASPERQTGGNHNE